MQYVSFILLYTLCVNVNCNFITTYQKHFGSKTPYRAVANYNEDPIIFRGCQPKKFWYIIRHGARSPTNEVLIEMKTNLPRIAQRIIEANERCCYPYINRLKKWRLPFQDETVLTKEGGREMYNLALRTQARFPALFPKTYSKTHYNFRHTNTKRTRLSAQNFTLGLFGYSYRDVEFPTPSNDSVLRFHKTCARWKKEVDNNFYDEVDLFRKSDMVKNVVAMVNSKLNLNGTLTFNDIEIMYKGCVHEAASFRRSIWCFLLPLKAIKVYEFVDSLRNYHDNGYLFDVNYKQACPLFKAMIDHFGEDESPVTSLQFSHDGTILKFYAHLGLFKDDHHLRHTDYNQRYKWNVSNIGPFGTNIAFVSYTCSSTEKIAVFFNERLIQLPNCDDLCDLETIKANYNDSINCAYNQICNITTTL